MILYLPYLLPMDDETKIEKIELMAELSEMINGQEFLSDEQAETLRQLEEIQNETGVTFFSAPNWLFTRDNYLTGSETKNSVDFYKYNSRTMFMNPNCKLVNASKCLYLDVNGVPVFAVYQNTRFQMFIENFIGQKRASAYRARHIPNLIPYDGKAVIYGKVIGDGTDDPLRFIAHEIVEIDGGIIKYAKTYEREIELMRTWGFETVPVAFLDCDEQRDISVKALEKIAGIFKIPADGCLLIE